MSLSELAASGRTDVIDGKTLYPLEIHHIGQFQNYIEQRHLANAAVASVDLDEDTSAVLLEAAQDFVVAGKLQYGTKAFNIAATQDANLSYLLYLSLLPGDKKITPSLAGKLITNANRSKIQRACLELGLGWEFAKNEVGAATETTTQPQ